MIYAFEVENGKEVLINNLVYFDKAGSYDQIYMSQVAGESYKSSKPEVASISKDGKLKTKKTGTADITVTYKGASLTARVEVVKKGAHKATGAKYRKMLSLTKKLSGYKKVTVANQYEISRLLTQVYDISDNVVSIDGFKKEKNSFGNYETSYKLVMPELLKYDINASKEKIDDYVSKNNPVGTNPSKYFKIKSVSVKKNSKNFTIRLKSKVNAAQIFAIKERYHNDSIISGGKTAKFRIFLKDVKTGYYYRGWATATEKSDQIKVSMDYYTLRAGQKYKLLDLWVRGEIPSNGWTKGRTVTVPKK